MEIAAIFINKILSEAFNRGAVSLHLSIGSQPMMRLDGEMISIVSENIVDYNLMNSIINYIADEAETQEFKDKKGIVLVKEFSGNIRCRISVFYQKRMPSMSFHFIPGTIKSPTDLNVPDSIEDFTKMESGLFIVAGPFGSGKTTTAVSIIEEVNNNENKYIITLENPVEYLFLNKKSIIDQRQIGRDVNSVVDGLNFCLSEDIDIIYISELKSNFGDAIPIIMSLAAGNSFVILEMNADSTMSAIEKILTAAAQKSSREASRYNLADVLSGIIVQKLLPQRGGGLVLASEILIVNSAVRSLVREGKIFQIESIIQTSRSEGMRSMRKSIEDLVQEGRVNQEDTLD